MRITVRGTAEDRHPAEIATVELAVVVEGPERADVAARAGAVLERLQAALRELDELQALRSWACDQVRIERHRPWRDDASPRETVHTARLGGRAVFIDFEALGSFVDRWGAEDGVEIVALTWDVAPEGRPALEADVRRRAVEDALAKAQSYADAVRRGRIVPVELADAGMLDDRAPGGAAGATAVRLAGGAGTPIALVPQDVVVRAEVDGRFEAD